MKNEIIRDFVSAENYKALNYATSCEDCTHFNQSDEKCTFGYPTEPHRRHNQLKDLQNHGMIAFCRTMEID